jgi:hypothetical protein
MIDDFNPLDLSAARPKVAEVVAPPEPPRAKPTVKRVSMGPILHSPITKVIVLMLGLVLTSLIGYSFMSYVMTKVI